MRLRKNNLIHKVSPSLYLIFCTAPVQKVEEVVTRLLAEEPLADIVYCGPDDSPFRQKNSLAFVSWGTGRFSWNKIIGMWPNLKTFRANKVLLPLNNPEGKGYFALRFLARLLGRNCVTEVEPNGRVLPITLERFLRPLQLGERFYPKLFSVMDFLIPVFRIWLRPGLSQKPAPSGTPISFDIVQEGEEINEPEASIIIRTYNEGRFLQRTLEAVMAQKDVTREVIVIDSQSTDDTLSIARVFPVKIISIRKDDFHYGAVLNLGARLAKGDILVNLSAHAVPAGDDWLKNIIRPLMDPAVAGVHGRELPMENWCGLFEKKILADSFDDHFILRINDSFFSNANSAVRKKIWRAFTFDETVGWGEDRLWAHQVQKAGYRTVYQPLTAVYHSHNLTMKENFHRCLKYYQMLFATLYKGRESRMREEFRQALAERSISFARYLSEGQLLNPFLAFFYAPVCEYVNYLGCEIAWREIESREELFQPVREEVTNSRSPEYQVTVQ
ncbi:MAG: glycosyltransferase [Nitrospinales bacterium]